MSDAELVALASLVQAEAVMMQGDNEYAKQSGYLPTWRDGTGFPPYTEMLREELAGRKLDAST